MSESTELTMESAIKTVTAAGTREPLATGRINDMRVRSVTIRALTSNGGNVYVGDSRVTSAAFAYILSPGETIAYQVSWEGWQHGESIDLADIYLDVAVSGEGVCYTVLRD